MSNGILAVLNRHCDHWRGLIPMLESGVIGTHETRDGKHVDTTDETIQQTRVWLAETEALIAKIEAGNA